MHTNSTASNYYSLAKERLICWDFEGRLSKSTVQSIGMSRKFYLKSPLPHKIIKRLSQTFVMVMKITGQSRESKGAVLIVPKQAYTFVKNVMLDLTQNVSKVFILSNIYTLIFHFLAYYMYLFCIDYMFFL